MQALLFEVQPKPGHEDHYLRHAMGLKPIVEQNDGLLYLDRFKSLSRPDLILSHSRWRDEAALAHWRSDATHYRSQVAGRHKHFQDYRIRVSQVITYQKTDSKPQAFNRDSAYLHPDAKPARYHVIVASKGKPFAADGETFSSINFEASYLQLVDCNTREQGDTLLSTAVVENHVSEVLLCVTSRDYTLMDRAEAPQYFPEAGS